MGSLRRRGCSECGAGRADRALPRTDSESCPLRRCRELISPTRTLVFILPPKQAFHMLFISCPPKQTILPFATLMSDSAPQPILYGNS
eukprot:365577-Chlamydomonas_euryale.AAC.3